MPLGSTPCLSSGLILCRCCLFALKTLSHKTVWRETSENRETFGFIPFATEYLYSPLSLFSVLRLFHLRYHLNLLAFSKMHVFCHVWFPVTHIERKCTQACICMCVCVFLCTELQKYDCLLAFLGFVNGLHCGYSEGVSRLLIAILKIFAVTVAGCAQTARITRPDKAWWILLLQPRLM
jgi:hypothetical protein